MIGRRKAITAAACATFMPGTALSCQISSPRPNPVFDRQAQEKRLRLVESFFEKIDRARSFEEIERSTASMRRASFRWPAPQPTQLLEAIPVGDLVIARARGIEATPENECNPFVTVHAYYSFHFDQDQIALMNTISYGALWPAPELPEAIPLKRG
jgi:hypothetical protein